MLLSFSFYQSKAKQKRKNIFQLLLKFPLTLVSRRGYAEKWSPAKWSPEKWFPEKWSRENWCPEKSPSKIVLHQKNARKFKRLFYFYQLIRLHTQKDVWRLRHDPTHAPNCRTLKESRKIYCRVLGFHRLITSEHSRQTPRCSAPTPRFFVSEFPGDQFSGDQFSGDHFSRGSFFPGTIFPGFLQKHITNIFNISFQLKYCRNIFFKYYEFHCDITILTLKYF